MNIKEAKQEVVNTVKAYLMKDDTGAYRIPVEKQRPVLLMGPPGIGKTAIMEQIAEELNINLVSYTITHHTRQSAIGLPYISKKNYGGEEYSVTEYTMSEIIAAIYDQIERSGVSEGILFLDEINCVSETLAPTMLQFLQYKTFGSHRVPEGFVIVTAGNPPEYNKSVRDFDIVTLDRVKRIDIAEDFKVWKEYAYKMEVCGAILAYLEIKKDKFYSVKAGIEGKHFVTARGWEDLSRIIKVYEDMELPITRDLVAQYIGDPEIARDFATYYELYNKYRVTYQVPSILAGEFPKDIASIVKAPFDEKLSLLGLMIETLNREFRKYAENLDIQREVFAEVKKLKAAAGNVSGNAGIEKDSVQGGYSANVNGLYETLRTGHDFLKNRMDKNMKAHMLSRYQAKIQRKILLALEELEEKLTLSGGNNEELFAAAKQWFTEREASRTQAIKTTGDHLTNAFEFINKTFGEGQELVIFLSDLNAGFYSLKFISECGNDAYYKYNQYLLLKDQRAKLRDEVMKAMEL
ncbi:AAA family ATPase [Oribacterium sp. WCC10]|uniref:AAA family ATPase n=1 Tax=Oribacterium sp. WCC10 TaxID=1855343 RepID=UPI0008E77942|nr:MoxR family ATPase [Oribacterium sp. WCC10]SFG15445.1 AAA domain (dynein-related subfamily) [Oribacterium sp. WCC10]